jgi:hypothetical protein
MCATREISTGCTSLMEFHDPASFNGEGRKKKERKKKEKKYL